MRCRIGQQGARVAALDQPSGLQHENLVDHLVQLVEGKVAQIQAAEAAAKAEAAKQAEALVVEDAVQCGTCRPRPQPVPMPELD